MPEAPPVTSLRRDELLERAYHHCLQHGLTGLSLRPLAASVGSSPRVLLFLFGSKESLVQALLARARADELELLDRVRSDGVSDLAGVASQVWHWLAADEHRGLLRLWVESYAKSLVEPGGSWSGFARATVEDWLFLLAQAQPPRERASRAGQAQRTLVLAVLRGALLDLLATGDTDRVGDAVQRSLDDLRRGAAPAVQ